VSALALRQRVLLTPRTGSGLRPSFAWDFRRRTLHPAMSFSRASAASYVDSDGLLKQAPAHSPCFEHDPLTGACLGLSCWMQSTNQVAHSQALTAGGWRSTNVTVTDGAQPAPDGTASAATIRENGATAVHEVEYDVSIVTGSVYGVSVFVKNISGARWINFGVSGGNWFNFQPSTGTVGSSNGLAGIVTRAIGGGWYRISALYTAPASTTTSVRLYLSATNAGIGGPSYSGDNSSTIAAWGFQFETAGVGVTSYIPTNGSTATRSVDVCAMALASMSGWDGTQGGAVVAAYRPHAFVPPVPGYQQMAAYLFKTDYQNSVSILAQDGGGGYAKSQVWSGGMYQNGLTASAVGAPFTRRRQALGWSAGRLAVAIDGGPVTGSSGSYALPAGPPDTLWLGYYIGHALQGTLESVAYYKGARPDAFVQGVSR